MMRSAARLIPIDDFPMAGRETRVRERQGRKEKVTGEEKRKGSLLFSGILLLRKTEVTRKKVEVGKLALL